MTLFDQGGCEERVRTAKHVFDWGRFFQVGLRIAALETDDLHRRIAALQSGFLKTDIVAMAKDFTVTSIDSPADRRTAATGTIDARSSTWR
jgi:hypothetical protein